MAYSALRWSFSSPALLLGKNPSRPPHSRVIAPLSPEMVLTRKQNDAGGRTEFRGEQSRREIVSPRIFLGKKRLRDKSRVSKYVYVSYLYICGCVCVCVSLGVAQLLHSSFAQDRKIRRRESGTLTRSLGNSEYFYIRFSFSSLTVSPGVAVSHK